MAHLDQVIRDPLRRRLIYQIFAALGIVLTAVQVAFSSLPDPTQPVWLGVSLAVYAFLAGAGFAVAQSNTEKPDEVEDVNILHPAEPELYPYPLESYTAKHAAEL